LRFSQAAHTETTTAVHFVTAANAVIVMHNLSSGANTPSEADIKVTLDLIRAGQRPKMEWLASRSERHTRTGILAY
jgi:DNA repair protein RadC